MFKRQEPPKPDPGHLQLSLAHAADNYQTIQAAHNLILQLQAG